MLEKLVSRVTVAVSIAALLGVAAWAQQQTQQKSPWKDRAEYDLYTSIVKEQDVSKKVQLLDSYMQKYPESKFKEQAYTMYAQAYQTLKQASKMYDAALQILKLNAKNVQGLYFITSLTTSMGETDAEHLANGEKYAKALVTELSPMQKPANLSAADWKKQKDALLVVAHEALGWIAMNRKNNVESEKEFRQVLKITPTNGQVSYWLGTVIIAQRDPDKQSEAFFHFARAANHTGPGAMAPAGRKQVDTYLRKIYTGFHGDESGLDELVAMAQKSAFPQTKLNIKSKEQIVAEKEEQLRKENPKLALWLNVKKELTGPNGATYFASKVKNTAMPGLRGYLISQSPAQRPDTLVLGLSGRSTREVTLKLDRAFRYAAGRGTVLNFQCVPQRFSAQPFNLGFDCVQEKVSGWPPPPSRTKTRK